MDLNHERDASFPNVSSMRSWNEKDESAICTPMFTVHRACS